MSVAGFIAAENSIPCGLWESRHEYVHLRDLRHIFGTDYAHDVEKTRTMQDNSRNDSVRIVGKFGLTAGAGQTA